MTSPPAAAPAPAKTPWRLVLLVALVPALDAVFRLGRLHPDEVYQHLEPGLHRAFGFGFLSWEWQVGLRNWAVPGLIAGVLKLTHALGVDDVQARRAAIEVPQYALHAAMLAAVFRLTARRVGAEAAKWAVVLVGLFPLVIWFAGRTMSESLSAAFLVWGLERLDARDERWAAAWGGLFLGFAEVARYGSAAVILPAMLWLAVTRQWRALLLCTAGGLLVAVGLGALDLETWGDSFHSLKKYVDFNLVSGQAVQQFGAAPAWAYLPQLLVAPWAVVGLALMLKRAVRPGLPKGEGTWLWFVAAVGYLVAISATPHKEARFLYPGLILLTVAGAPAFADWARAALTTPGGSPHPKALAVLSIAACVGFFVARTPFDVERAEQFQFLVRASRGATGVIVMNEGIWGAGGLFYLGRDMPWCTCDFPADPCFQQGSQDPRINRGLYWADSSNAQRNADATSAFTSRGFHVVDQRGPATYFER